MIGRELAAGLGCTIAGLVILLLSLRYEFATTADIGPGVFPAVAAILLGCCGILISARAWGRARTPRTHDQAREHWRAPIAVSAGLAAFALLIDTAGFLIAAPTLILLASRGDPRSTLSEVVTLAALLTSAAALLFVWGLGLPLRLMPDVIGLQ
jgi:hypothetical protein